MISVRYNDKTYNGSLCLPKSYNLVKLESVPAIVVEGFEIKEDDQKISLFEKLVKFNIEPNGYCSFTDAGNREIWFYDKVDGWGEIQKNDFFELSESGLTITDESDYRDNHFCSECLLMLFDAVTKFLNPWFFNKLCSGGQSLYINSKSLYNFWKILESKEMVDAADKIVSAMGINYFFQNINNSETGLELNVEGKKARQIIGLPDKVVQLMKDNVSFSKMRNVFRTICADDANEGIFLVEYAETVRNLKTFKSDDNAYKLVRFVQELARAKELRPDVKIQRLVRYLIKQEFYYGFNQYPPCSWGVKDSIRETFLPPAETAREYADYLTISGPSSDLYPRNIFSAHNVCVRNMSIISDEALSTKYEEAVKKFEPMCYNGKEFLVTYPKTVKELVDEGNTLEHCVASYAPVIANGKSIVLCVRTIDAPDTPFVTLEIDNDFNVIQVKGKYDIDVTEKPVLEFVHEWSKIQKKKGKKDET